MLRNIILIFRYNYCSDKEQTNCIKIQFFNLFFVYSSFFPLLTRPSNTLLSSCSNVHSSLSVDFSLNIRTSAELYFTSFLQLYFPFFLRTGFSPAPLLLANYDSYKYFPRRVWTVFVSFKHERRYLPK